MHEIGYLIVVGHFPHKSPIIGGSFAENDLQLKAFYGSRLMHTKKEDTTTQFKYKL